MASACRSILRFIRSDCRQTSRSEGNSKVANSSIDMTSAIIIGVHSDLVKAVPVSDDRYETTNALNTSGLQRAPKTGTSFDTST